MKNREENSTYMFFNRQSCVDEPFSSRVDRVVLDTMAAKGKVIGIDPIPKINMTNFLAPRGIDLTHFAHFALFLRVENHTLASWRNLLLIGLR